jgi:tetratricopeptide (TPR) repeat protein
MATIQAELNLDQLREQVVNAVVQRMAKSSPELTQAIFYCAVPRWFDAKVVAGMRSRQASTDVSFDQILSQLIGVPFCEPHATREATWILKEDFRETLLQRKEVKENWKELQARAANTFKRRLDEKSLEGEQRFNDPDWKDFAVEWLYHVLQLNPAEALREVRKVCAQALGVWTSDEQPEVIFCSEFLGSLNWTNAPEDANQQISFLRAGINALLNYDNRKAVAMLEGLANLPELSSEEQGVLRDWVGRIYFEDEERYAPASEQLEKAQQLIPTNAYVQGRIAALHYWPGPIWGRFDLAQKHAKRALKLAPNKSNGYYALGTICQELEDWDQAIVWFQRACEVAPNDYGGYLGLSEVYSAIGDVGRALALIDKANQVSPNIKYFALIRKGNVYRDAQRFRESLDFYAQAITEARDRLDAYLESATSHTELWRFAEAEEEYRKVIELDAEEARAYVGWANLYQKQEKWADAITKCQEAINKGIRAKSIYLLLHDLYRWQNRLQELKGILGQLVSYDPAEEYRVLCLFGDDLLAQALQRWDSPHKEEWLEEARSEFEQALAIDSVRAWAHISLAKLAVFRNDRETLEEQRQIVSKRSPWAEYDMLVDLGGAYLRNFQYSHSRKVLEAAAILAPRRTGAWQALSEWQYMQGDPQGVIQAWSELVKINPHTCL